MPENIFNCLDDLEKSLQDIGIKKFRIGQIKRWLFDHRVTSFEQMTNLPASLRATLAERFTIFSTSVGKHEVSADGTEKLLVTLPDGQHVECVLLRDGERRSICVSSQVGCAMGCVFCASGLDGVERNLTAGEILQQMLHLQHLLPREERLSHIVMMGMGEPLANLENLLKALHWASHSDGLGISPRRITISTVGIPKAIQRLADKDCRYHLAISLHAPNDPLRNQLVPINKKVGVKELMDAADHYFAVSGRKLTFEYVLLKGINDSEKHATELVRLLKGKIALLNVIPYNPVDGLPYQTPSPSTIGRFRKVLESGGIVVKFRQRKGDKINAACGQLRRNSIQLTTLGQLSPK
ncbi:MAG: 23S rRNA (adenine(2503)-C(2))-methyltransferase RlmN [Planctomycetota bacterium]